jgi:hypothetical protein
VWTVTVANEHLFSLMNTTLQSFQGPLWSLMTYYATPGLTEMFLYDGPDAPHGVFRVAPFYNVDAPDRLASLASSPELGSVTLDPAQVSGSQLGYSDLDVLNFFLIQPDTTGSLTISTLAAYLQQGGNPREDATSQQVYGYRPMMVSTPLLSVLTKDAKKQHAGILRQQASAMATYLYQTQHANQTLASGTITVHGQPEWIPGRYLEIPDVGRYYLQGVQETFQAVGAPQPSWLATLSVTRGQVATLDVVPEGE